MTFGGKLVGKLCITRPDAYGVLFDNRDNLAVVDLCGPHFRPGGGTEGEEYPQETLRRKLLEELGVFPDTLVPVATIREHLFSSKRHEYFTIDSVYFYVPEVTMRGHPSDTSHGVKWVEPTIAERTLSRPEQVWIVRQVLRRFGLSLEGPTVTQ